MKLVVDSNIIFSAIISPGGKTAELIFVKGLELFSAKTLEQELFEHKGELMKKACLPEIYFDLLRELLFSKISFLEEKELDIFIPKAKEICPDVGDVAFFAVCLAKDIPLWSNDKELKKQSVVKVINTEELSMLVG